MKEIVVVASTQPSLTGEKGGGALDAQDCLEPYMQMTNPTCPTCRTPVTRDAVFMGTHVAEEESYINPRRARPS